MVTIQPEAWMRLGSEPCRLQSYFPQLSDECYLLFFNRNLFSVYFLIIKEEAVILFFRNDMLFDNSYITIEILVLKVAINEFLVKY